MPVIFCPTGLVARIGGKGRTRRQKGKLFIKISYIWIVEKQPEIFRPQYSNLVLRYLVTN